MKLAESWVEDVPAITSVNHFHDEGEEDDEEDEAEDGCGGVVWGPYVLKKAHTSNKQLHELAREIRGTEKGRGRKLTHQQYKVICGKWELASKPFLTSGNDYYIELLAKLDCVTVPKGETLLGAFERAKLREPPEKVMIVQNENLRVFANLCRELQEMAGEQPIMLSQTSVAKLFGHSSHRTISNWIKALKTLGMLQIAEHWKPGKATRYFFIPNSHNSPLTEPRANEKSWEFVIEALLFAIIVAISALPIFAAGDALHQFL